MSKKSGSTALDASKLKDPIASQTEWTPVKCRGTRFKKLALKVKSKDRVEFVASWRFILTCLSLVVAGALLAFLFVEAEYLYWKIYLCYFFGALIAAAGIALFLWGSVPYVFDKQSGYCWKGRKNARQVINKGDSNALTILNEIHAIQLVSDYFDGSSTPYYTYQLNLVLKDANRRNVINHGKQNAVEQDAEKLAQFLDVPIWSAL
jgi:hypothetical protein